MQSHLLHAVSTMHVMQPKDMFKQARQISRASQDETVPGGEAKKRGGQELRQYLLEKFAAEGMSGSEVATLAHYITRAGGLGLEDLALDPKSASKKRSTGMFETMLGRSSPRLA